MELVVVGSVAYDSLETPSGKRERILGGSASYFSIAASFFTRLGLVAVIGEDFEDHHIKLLERFEVDLKGLEKKAGKTFHWQGRYEDLNQAITIQTDLNVFESFKPNLPDKYRTAKTLFLANIDPDLQMDVVSQVENPGFVACDTMNYWINTKREPLLKTLEKVDLLFINDAEARQLSKIENVFKAGKWILENGPKAVVIKRGEYGAMIMQGKKLFIFPAFPIEGVVDPTGAGDSFAGGFMGYLHATGDHSFENMKTALAMGTVMASFTVQDFSVDRLAALTYAEVENQYRKLMEYTGLKQIDLGGLKSSSKKI
jgi:sugar/nucleoside kinase (ribokinase family)